MRRVIRAAIVAGALVGATVPVAPLLSHAAAAAEPLTVTDSAATYAVTDGSVGVSITKSPWLLSLTGADGSALAAERDPSLPDQTTNAFAQANANFDQSGHDKAYPGLPSVSTRPLAYLRGGTWRYVTAFNSAAVDQSARIVTIAATTSDGARATVTLTFRDGAVDLRFRPRGTPASAVAETWQYEPTQHFFGGGGRFLRPELTGLSVPLWVSHGIGADRYTYTNEIAVPYLASTGGWAVADNTGARGEMDVSIPERPGSVSMILEDTHLDLTLYDGSLQQMLTHYTADTGREPAPPQWAFTPMWWDDAENSQVEIDRNIAALRSEDIPVGAYWIDNPWQKFQGDFAPDPHRFPAWESWVKHLHASGIHLVTWVSPFFDARSNTGSAMELGPAPADGDDHTYIPARGINNHVDLTDPHSYDLEVQAAAALLRSGVDGFKMDRSEEDFGDGVEYANGMPNALGHSHYVLLYDKAMREACTIAHPDGDCLLMARGGVGGSSGYVGNWAGDSTTVEGPVGLLPAIHHLLAEAMSGQPIWASDIGGYSPRQGPVTPGTPPLSPSPGTFVRWAQFGAVSPIFESPNHPSDYDAATIEALRAAAVLHDRLAPYTHAAAVKAEHDGTPIAQPLALAFPADPVAPTIDDEYVFDSCLLAAPIHTGTDDEGPAARSVYFPGGSWTNVLPARRLSDRPRSRSPAGTTTSRCTRRRAARSRRRSSKDWRTRRRSCPRCPRRYCSH